ncbi:hypothetical protein ACFFK0_20600 [Paenibacillus chartarius]|uniref:Uncharacterized protein n=1 Tax=Paenibacillus chartarius TaxID=747481 RepID=A0ABV6DQ78_9BACL
MKLRLLPIVVSVAVSSVVLFGGWFGYHSFAMENPMKAIVEQIPGVSDAQMQLKRDEVQVSLRLGSGASLREVYQTIETKGASIIGDRKVNVEVTNETSPEIDRWWSSALFDVAQAMETKQYADIPKVLEQHKSSLPGLTVLTEMDDDNVYVQLSDGEKSKYVILPRVAPKLGVFVNG